jgi:hypothetical protein
MKHVNEVKSPGPQESQKGERSKMTIKKEGTHSSTQVRNKFAYSIAAGSSIRMESVRPFSIKSVHQVKSTKWPTYLSKGEGPVKSSDAHTPARSKVKTSQVAHVPPQGQRSVAQQGQSQVERPRYLQMVKAYVSNSSNFN